MTRVDETSTIGVPAPGKPPRTAPSIPLPLPLAPGSEIAMCGDGMEPSRIVLPADKPELWATDEQMQRLKTCLAALEELPSYRARKSVTQVRVNGQDFSLRLHQTGNVSLAERELETLLPRLPRVTVQASLSPRGSQLKVFGLKWTSGVSRQGRDVLVAFERGLPKEAIVFSPWFRHGDASRKVEERVDPQNAHALGTSELSPLDLGRSIAAEAGDELARGYLVRLDGHAVSVPLSDKCIGRLERLLRPHVVSAHELVYRTRILNWGKPTLYGLPAPSLKGRAGHFCDVQYERVRINGAFRLLPTRADVYSNAEAGPDGFARRVESIDLRRRPSLRSALEVGA